MSAPGGPSPVPPPQPSPWQQRQLDMAGETEDQPHERGIPPMSVLAVEHGYCPMCAFEGVEPPADPEREAREKRRLLRELRAAQEAARQRHQQSARRQSAERRRQLEADAPGHATPEQVAARWAYYGGKCWICDAPAQCMDHIKPLARGGCKWPSNLRPACLPCNYRKGPRWPYRRRVTNAGS